MTWFKQTQEADPVTYGNKENPASSLLALTPEQEAIIGSTGNIRVNAVAGSGKTTTMIEYARSRPAGARILYLAFNRSVKAEAVKKFAQQGLAQVRVETAHSLAYPYVVPPHRYTVRPQGYTTHEIADLLGPQPGGDRHTGYVVASHVNRFLTYFCNSDALKVAGLNYPDSVGDARARAFVQAFYPHIERGTRQLLARMNGGDIAVTHDFYLKKFQLQHPVLPYDYILFDEGQDASAAMLDIFLRQPAVKVIVGDAHQQIYGWRLAINSLEHTGFPAYGLTHSFRFGPGIAGLATRVLDWKGHLAPHAPVVLTGCGGKGRGGSRATIARTNLGLLLRAIEYITAHPDVRHIYFEGNLHSYTYADEGASLYDVLHLYNGHRGLVRDKLLQSMQDLVELEDYIEKTDDAQLAMMVKMVREYGNALPGLIRTLKEKHTADREEAEMVFSTVHRCKGMEYDAVQLVDDFVSEGRLERLKLECPGEEGPDIAKWMEEINLLYVAVTRARISIRIPEPLLPKDLPPCPEIQVIKPQRETIWPAAPPRYSGRYRKAGSGEEESTTHTYTRVRKGFSDTYQAWTADMDRELRQLYEEGTKLVSIARHFGRTPSTIIARLRKLGM